MNLINIGYGNVVATARVLTITDPDSAPSKRIVKAAKEKGRLIDATYGRTTRAVIVTDSDHIILAPIMPKTLASRMEQAET